MIIEIIFSSIMALVKLLINLIPGVVTLPAWVMYFNDLVSYALMFFPPDCWSVLIANFVFWMTAHMSWATIEWCYKKIPGVS